MTLSRSLLAVAFASAAGLVLASWPGSASSADAGGSVAGEVTILKKGRAKGDRSRVVVYLKDVPGRPTVSEATISQQNKRFDPALTVVTKGSRVEFPNRDKIFHNVFSVSRPARFDLGLYKSGTSRSVKLRRAGTVDVYCNIHPEMVAKIKVLDTGYYAVTGRDGRFRIDGVPPGTYPIIAWQAYGQQFEGTVTVAPGKTATVKLTLKEGAQPRRHLRKDGTPYGRYK